MLETALTIAFGLFVLALLLNLYRLLRGPTLPDRALALEAGDLLAVRSAGAYGFAMASNYNSRGRPAEILVDGDQAFVVRQRETIEDQLKLETLLP